MNELANGLAKNSYEMAKKLEEKELAKKLAEKKKLEKEELDKRLPQNSCIIGMGARASKAYPAPISWAPNVSWSLEN